MKYIHNAACKLSHRKWTSHVVKAMDNNWITLILPKCQKIEENIQYVRLVCPEIYRKSGSRCTQDTGMSGLLSALLGRCIPISEITDPLISIKVIIKELSLANISVQEVCSAFIICIYEGLF